MFHVKDNFKAGDPVSAVGASWFNKVGALLNNLVGGYGIRLTKNERGISTVEVDPDALPSVSTVTGTPDERTDAGADDDEAGEAWTWTAGGGNGLVLDCYCKVVEDDGWHMLCRARLTFSRSGLLVKAEGLAGRRLGGGGRAPPLRGPLRRAARARAAVRRARGHERRGGGGEMRRAPVLAAFAAAALLAARGRGFVPPTTAEGWYTPSGGFKAEEGFAYWEQGGKQYACMVTYEGTVVWTDAKPNNYAAQVAIEEALMARALINVLEESVEAIATRLAMIDWGNEKEADVEDTTSGRRRAAESRARRSASSSPRRASSPAAAWSRTA